MNEDIAPCPFCGSSGMARSIHKPDDVYCLCTHSAFEKEEWNDAWAHKNLKEKDAIIDTLNKKLREDRDQMQKEAQDLVDRMNGAYVKGLEMKMETAVKTLRAISSCGCSAGLTPHDKCGLCAICVASGALKKIDANYGEKI